MPKRHFRDNLMALSLLLISGFGGGTARADFMLYEVDVNTSAVGAQTGFLDFQLNPGGLGAQAATATVTNFQTLGGILVGSAMVTGDASGSLPGTLTLDNGTAFNDIFQGFIYGRSFSFDLALSGAAVGNPGGVFGSSFALSLYAADGITPLLTTDPNGSVLTINLNTSGTIGIETFSQSQTNNTPAAVVTQVGAVAVPEPSSFALFVIAMAVGCPLLIRAKRYNSSRTDINW
jgi:hypothetical protein